MKSAQRKCILEWNTLLDQAVTVFWHSWTPWNTALRKLALLNGLLTPLKHNHNPSFFSLGATSPQHAEHCNKSNTKDSRSTHFSIKTREGVKAHVQECYTYLSKFSSSLLFLHSSMCNQIVKHFPYNSITRFINANFTIQRFHSSSSPHSFTRMTVFQVYDYRLAQENKA